MLWSTSMEIPAGEPNAAAAEAWMNFVYNPKVQPTSGVRQLRDARQVTQAFNGVIYG